MLQIQGGSHLFWVEYHNSKAWFSSQMMCSKTVAKFFFSIHPPHCNTHQAFDHLQQLLHHHGDALVAQQAAHDLDVGGAHKVLVGAEYAAVRQVQGLHGGERR